MKMTYRFLFSPLTSVKSHAAELYQIPIRKELKELKVYLETTVPSMFQM